MNNRSTQKYPPGGIKPRYTIKQILLSNQNWWNFYQRHKNKLRSAILICIVKLLSCKEVIRGSREYHCSNANCSHVKYIFFSCKCKACSSCGKKATELWIQKQNHLLPNTSWQHITFTMPSELWDFFWLNRTLLDPIGKMSADCIKTIADKKKITPAIFIAIHTFGRDLKRNVHIHLSTTTGGLSEDLTQWKNLFFHQATLMRMWRYRIIQLFRKSYPQLIIPPAIRKQLDHTFTFNQFLDRLYKKIWIVHCSKPSANHKKNVEYLGRYVKRPAIAESKLKHYDGRSITFKYLDHNTKTYRNFILSTEEFIGRFVQHIPDIGFRMIRYYGFLANRVRGKRLPIAYTLLGQTVGDAPSPLTFAQLIQKDFKFNPFLCILCGQQLILSAVRFGKTSINALLAIHAPLALMKTP